MKETRLKMASERIRAKLFLHGVHKQSGLGYVNAEFTAGLRSFISGYSSLKLSPHKRGGKSFVNWVEKLIRVFVSGYTKATMPNHGIVNDPILKPG